MRRSPLQFRVVPTLRGWQVECRGAASEAWRTVRARASDPPFATRGEAESYATHVEGMAQGFGSRTVRVTGGEG